jgi:hypothetical protein
MVGQGGVELSPDGYEPTAINHISFWPMFLVPLEGFEPNDLAEYKSGALNHVNLLITLFIVP